LGLSRAHHCQSASAVRLFKVTKRQKSPTAQRHSTQQNRPCQRRGSSPLLRFEHLHLVLDSRLRRGAGGAEGRGGVIIAAAAAAAAPLAVAQWGGGADKQPQGRHAPAGTPTLASELDPTPELKCTTHSLPVLMECILHDRQPAYRNTCQHSPALGSLAPTAACSAPHRSSRVPAHGVGCVDMARGE